MKWPFPRMGLDGMYVIPSQPRLRIRASCTSNFDFKHCAYGQNASNGIGGRTTVPLHVPPRPVREEDGKGSAASYGRSACGTRNIASAGHVNLLMVIRSRSRVRQPKSTSLPNLPPEGELIESQDLLQLRSRNLESASFVVGKFLQRCISAPEITQVWKLISLFPVPIYPKNPNGHIWK